MKKIMLVVTITFCLLVGCSSLEKNSGESTVLVITPHSLKTAATVTFPVDPNKWNGFFKKEEVSIMEEEREMEETGTSSPNKPEDSEEAIPVVTNPTSIHVMVNKSWALPEGYRPSDLTRPNVPFSFGNENSDRSKLRKEAAQALEIMFESALDDGVELYARSGFRSYEAQEAIFQSEIAAFGYEQAVLYVARPGTSEHQTGLTMDITAKSVKLELVESFEDTKEGKWLANNAHHHGFILRYPKGKTNITGYAFEPWHYRYIGVDIATEIFTKGITLEEYMGDVREF